LRIEAGLVRAVFALARRLGPERASALGGGALRRMGPRLPVSNIGRRNLALAFPQSDVAWREAVLADAWDNLGRSMLEMPLVAQLRETASGPGWELAGEENLPPAGTRMVMFSAHLANWELLPRAGLRFGIQLASLYRAPDNPFVDAEVRRMREGGADLPLFPKGSRGARQALRHLMQGGALGLVVDQKLNEGLSIPFFGHPAMTAPAVAEFALRFRCPLIPAHVERIGPARFRVVVEPPLALPESGDHAADVWAVMEAVNLRIEDWVRARPGEWLWLHRRFPKDVYRNEASANHQ
jgi:KDO2-lipid IV(A) lauroyltransferase